MGHLFHGPKPLGGPSPPWKTLGIPASGIPATVQEQDRLGSLFFRRKTHRRGQSALGPQLQKWVTRGKKVVKKRQTLFGEPGLSIGWKLSVP